MNNPFLEQLGKPELYQELLFKKFEYDKAKRSRILRFLLALDQLFNVLLFNGSQDETISSHIGRKIQANKANKFEIALCRFLNLFERQHCAKSRGE